MALAEVLLLLFVQVVVSQWIAKEYYDVNNCSVTPIVVDFVNGTKCLTFQCTAVRVNNATPFVHDVCNITNGFEYARTVFPDENFIVVENYAGVGCEDLHNTIVVRTTGRCTDAGVSGSYSIISTLYSNGSALIMLFTDRECDGDAYMNVVLDSGNTKSGDCVENYTKFYTAHKASESVLGVGTDVGSDGSSSSRTVMTQKIIIITLVVVAVIAFITAAFIWRRQVFYVKHSTETVESSMGCDNYTPLSDRQMSTAFNTSTRSLFISERQQRTISYFWNDEEIAAARVDRDKIEFGQVISQGGFGQVLSGCFNGQHVAIKVLLPKHRKCIKSINSFLEEVKLYSILEHPRIVQFVGVAWNSLSDLCLLTAFMEGGDLRALLASYESQNLPVGFDVTKVTIALHTAHALTYLHSLDPPVLHRDLKSKNILLSTSLDARLSDFGASCENVVDKSTMTGGVGTSHWMAPEVILGEKYDEKADVFSMGVVLSELDLHALPYSFATDENDPSRRLSSTALVHLVAIGQLSVKFSSDNLLAKLGLSCVAVNPNDRPTASEVLFKLHTVLTTEYGREGYVTGFTYL